VRTQERSVLLDKGLCWRQKENPPVVFEAFSDDEQRYDGFAKPCRQHNHSGGPRGRFGKRELICPGLYRIMDD
jgi:hypothetical protein